ncbi:MAG TPA: N-formylglutamate amidohydrolase [Polyangiaceae bacterium]|nr:N-formylglutamate amidohydrolase [Polyangiaceae bacterium]
MTFRILTTEPVPLLEPEEPPPYRVLEGDADSPFFLTCDHASNRLPKKLGDLGLAAAELERHIAWDIGAAGLSEALARELGGFLILQNYSRLAIDCNRPLSSETSITKTSEATEIPGNRGLGSEQALARIASIFEPYHRRIEHELARREQRGQSTVLLAIHSFTPVFHGVARPWHVGVLYQRDTRLAHALLQLLRSNSDLVVGDNQPYSVSDTSDYGIIQYGERRGLPHVELEVRQDLITEPAQQTSWARRLAPMFRSALGMAGI